LPKIVISPQIAPLWPIPTPSGPNGSVMITASAPSSRPCSTRKPMPGVLDADGLLVGHRALDDAPAPLGPPQRLDGDHLGGQPALHVGGAAAVDPAVRDLAAERVARPVVADRDDVVVAVEVDRRAGAAAVERGQQIRAREPASLRRQLVQAVLGNAHDLGRVAELGEHRLSSAQNSP
jgi:hypothetical protein